MDGAVKETLCTRCDKRLVCKYTNTLLELVPKIEKEVYLANDDDYIFSVQLKCKHFSERKGTIR